jgi:hypothetical protein
MIVSIRTHAPRGRVVFALLGIITIALLVLADRAPAGIGESSPLPAISSDKPDYAPGETVTLTGAFWAAGESVHVVVNDDAGQTWRYETEVTAGPDGSFSLQFNLPEWFVAVYTATASAASGTATTSFTDANLKFALATTDNAAPATVTWSVNWDQWQGTGQNPNNTCTGTRSSFGTANYSGNTLSSGSEAGINNNASAKPTSAQTTGAFAGTYELDYWSASPGSTTPLTAAQLCQAGVNGPTVFTFYAHFKLADATPPTTTASASPAANAAGWNKTNVTVDLNAVDNAGGSGVKEITYSASGAQTIASTTVAGSSVTGISITAEGTTTLSFFAKDNAGNTEATKTLVLKIDKTAPTVSCGSADGVWHATNVDIPCTASDAPSGLLNAGDASFNLSTNVAPGQETDNASTGTRLVTDKADNESTAGPVAGNKVDRKAPQLVACESPDGNWHAGNVTLKCTYSDGGSGPASQDVELTTNVAAGEETANAVASADGDQACDDVGNCAASPDDIADNKVDRKAPTFSCAGPASAWSATDVSRACTAADGGSGLDPASDASFSLSTNVPAGSETDDAQTGTKSLKDAVGNTTTAGPLGGNKVDKKGPVVTLVCPSSPIVKGNAASATWSAADGGSGVAPPSSGSIALDTSTVGTHSASAPAGTASDNVGNPSPASAPCSYTVVFNWTGFFQPIDNNPDQSGNPALATVWNSAKAGQAIPVKFSLHGDQGLSIFQAGYPKSTKVACPGALPVVDVIETYAASTPGLHYDPGADQYVYVWKTSTSLAGTCQRLEVKLVDGTAHYAFFKFVK